MNTSIDAARGRFGTRSARMTAAAAVLAAAAVGAVALDQPASAAAPEPAEGAPVRIVMETADGERVPGEDGDVITADAYSWSAESPGDSSGRPTGRTRFGDLTFVHGVGPGSVILTKALAEGRVLPSVTVDVMRQGGDGPAIAYRYVLSDARVVELAHGSGTSGATETVRVAYSKIRVATDNLTFAWDTELNAAG